MRLELVFFLSTFADEISGKRNNWCHIIKRKKDFNEIITSLPLKSSKMKHRLKAQYISDSSEKQAVFSGAYLCPKMVLWAVIWIRISIRRDLHSELHSEHPLFLIVSYESGPQESKKRVWSVFEVS